MPTDRPPSGGTEADHPLTPGARLMRAFVELDRLLRRGTHSVDRSALDGADLARVIGVADELEFVTEDAAGQHLHFPGEVLYLNPGRDTPCRLFTLEEWAARSELDNFSEDAS